MQNSNPPRSKVSLAITICLTLADQIPQRNYQVHQSCRGLRRGLRHYSVRVWRICVFCTLLTRISGRLRNQRSSTPPNFEAIKMLRAQTTLPVLANGDVYSLEDAHRIAKETGVDGVMAARGLLENPTLFAGFDKTPIEAVSQFIHYAVQGSMRHELVVHHLTEMLGSTTTKRERVGLAACNDMVDVIDWLSSPQRSLLQRPIP